jgi:hypothetical protein
MQETTRARNQQLLREQEDYDRNRVKELRDHYADLAQIDTQYYEKQAALLADLADIANEANADKLREIADATKEAQRANEDYVDSLEKTKQDLRAGALRLDAIAIYETQQRLKEQGAQYDKEKKRREEDLQDRIDELDDQRDERLAAGRKALEDLRKQHDKERADNERAFQLRLKEEDQERSIRLSRQRQDWAQEDAERARHVAQQVGLVQSGFDQVNAIARLGMDTFNTIVAGRIAAMISSVGGGIPTSIVQQAVGGALGRPVGAYGNGTSYVPPGTTAWVGDKGPELLRFLSPASITPHYQIRGGHQVTNQFNNTFGGNVSQAALAYTVRAEVQREVKRLLH